MAKSNIVAIAGTSSGKSFAYGIYWAENDERNTSERCGDTVQNIDEAELQAVVAAVESVKDYHSHLVIRTSRQNVLFWCNLLDRCRKDGWHNLPDCSPRESQFYYLDALLDRSKCTLTCEIICDPDSNAMQLAMNAPPSTPTDRDWLNAERSVRMENFRRLSQEGVPSSSQEAKKAGEMLSLVLKRIKRRREMLETGISDQEAVLSPALQENVSNQHSSAAVLQPTLLMPSLMEQQVFDTMSVPMFMASTLPFPPIMPTMPMWNMDHLVQNAFGMFNTPQTWPAFQSQETSTELPTPPAREPRKAQVSGSKQFNPSPPIYRSTAWWDSTNIDGNRDGAYRTKLKVVAEKCEACWPEIVESRARWPVISSTLQNTFLEYLRQRRRPVRAADTASPSTGTKRAHNEDEDVDETATKRLKLEDGTSDDVRVTPTVVPAHRHGYALLGDNVQPPWYILSGLDAVLEDLLVRIAYDRWVGAPLIAVFYLWESATHRKQPVHSFLPHVVSNVPGVKLVLLPKEARQMLFSQRKFDPFEHSVFGIKDNGDDLGNLKELLARVPESSQLPADNASSTQVPASSDQ
ncbi:hypothetical protein CYLTODRAFT_492294 [Cylindrobasidium torrendii FP15055 ss-10]|uniref:RNase H type-1 domain-containing protein n=1 Tax=Cylindrobasidium torrendii FP15055 ss-10 TaxID=1314674 RepID=A0A0D7B4G3_9AGAR|nr:hypothetical protein CYLTODRAFT_492294 [Cylindrobasidium torrendii FP15055 ss-10]